VIFKKKLSIIEDMTVKKFYPGKKIYLKKKKKYTKKCINIKCYAILEIFKFGMKEGTGK
jgi:hypothetical protein